MTAENLDRVPSRIIRRVATVALGGVLIAAFAGAGGSADQPSASETPFSVLGPASTATAEPNPFTELMNQHKPSQTPSDIKTEGK